MVTFVGAGKGEVRLQDGTVSKVVDWFIPLKGLETIYNNTNGGSIADITSGALLFYLVCDADITTGTWNMEYTSRLRFYD